MDCRHVTRVVHVTDQGFRSVNAIASKVLIIDDSRVSRIKARSLLLERHPDWLILEAGNALEGVELARREQPRLITLDVNMPDMSGIQATPLLRQVSPDSIIVLLTANIQDAIVAQARELAVGYVEKPVSALAIDKILAYLGSRA